MSARGLWDMSVLYFRSQSFAYLDGLALIGIRDPWCGIRDPDAGAARPSLCSVAPPVTIDNIWEPIHLRTATCAPCSTACGGLSRVSASRRDGPRNMSG